MTHTLSVVVLIAAAGLLGACRQPLFDRDGERSQFDRYDLVRDQTAPPYLEDEYGRRRPNLRGRLLHAGE
jgi:hypothetical protein